METVHVFGNTAIDRFSVTEIPFDNQKGVFDFAANGRFSVFYFFIPVVTRIRIGDFQTGRTLVVYADSGYLGVPKQEAVLKDEHLSSIEYRINKRPSSLKTTDVYTGIKETLI